MLAPALIPVRGYLLPLAIVVALLGFLVFNAAVKICVDFLLVFRLLVLRP